jgi:hypothetical protein
MYRPFELRVSARAIGAKATLETRLVCPLGKGPTFRFTLPVGRESIETARSSSISDIVNGGLVVSEGSFLGLKSGIGRVSRVSPVHTAMRNCTRDGGGPFEVGN